MRAALAMMIEEQDDQAPRLYSRQERAPIDMVAEQHLVIHGDLDAFGRWSRERYEQGECGSLEHNFDNTGGRAPSEAVVSLPENPRHHQIDRVVRAMRMGMHGVCLPNHGEAIRMYYVGALPRGGSRRRGMVYERCAPKTICHVLHLRYEDFAPFMFDCRAAVLNLLRRLGGG